MISSVLVANGVFRGVSRIVGLPDLPGDPPNFSRDDLVLSEGTMHLVSATVDITSFSLNPRNCLFRLTLQRGRRDTGAMRNRGSLHRYSPRRTEPDDLRVCKHSNRSARSGAESAGS